MANFKSHMHALQDLSIQDYADNPKIRKGSNRIKKSLLKKTMKGAPVVDCIQDTGDIADHAEDDENEDEFLNTFVNSSKRKEKGTNFSNNLSSQDGSAFNNFPMDVWLQIGMRIHPADVGRFSLICKHSHAVSRTRSFWKGIYLRWIRQKHIDSPYDYSECSQFFFKLHLVQDICRHYPPLIETSKRDLSYLLNRQCETVFEKPMLQQNGKPMPTLFIGFSKVDQGKYLPVWIKDPSSSVSKDRILVEPIFHRYVFLAVSTDQLVPPYASICKKRLVKFSDMRGDLCLTFSGMVQTRGNLNLYQGDVFELHLYNVTYKVINWWDPNFPENYITQCLTKKKTPEDNVPDSWEQTLDYT